MAQLTQKDVQQLVSKQFATTLQAGDCIALLIKMNGSRRRRCR
jgi:hypothetical protein